MKMNKRGSITIFSIMFALAIIILALALAPAVSEFTTNAMGNTSGDTLGMNCSTSTISDFQKAACVATDLNLFYFIAGVIFLAGAIIVGRVLLT